jgi:peptidyl-prolyl cis-trans isomerase B (cyclophilin B)
MKTSQGDITIELDKAKAPVTVENFLVYVNDKFYDGTIFHRVIPAFMIQGGGFDKDMKQKPTKGPIKNEAGNGLKNLNGTIAMARTSDPNSATAQFFINTKDNAFLDHRNETAQGYGYAVFGKVVGGMDVVKKIEQVQTSTKGMHENVPVTAVVIESVRVVE